MYPFSSTLYTLVCYLRSFKIIFTLNLSPLFIITTKILTGKPQGTLLVRPHDTDDESMLFLSFVGTAEESIKHAIIRREKVTVVDEGSSFKKSKRGEGCKLVPTGLLKPPINPS